MADAPKRASGNATPAKPQLVKHADPQTQPGTGDRSRWSEFGDLLARLLGNLTSPIKTTQSITMLGKGRLKIPTFDADPASAAAGEVAVIGGALKVATAADTWSTPGGGYGGKVTSAGSGTLPAGWSVSLSGTDYTITHNLGTTGYAVVAMPINFSPGFTVSLTRNSNTFVISFGTSSGYFATDFDFILTPI